MATFYTAKTGSNSNVGSLASPFLTIAYAISKMVGGDKLYVRSGTYNEELLFYDKNGTLSNPSIISAYTGEHPIIDGNGISPTGDALVNLYYSDYAQIIGFEVKNAVGTGIQTTGVNNLVSNCTVHDCQASGIQSFGDYGIVEYCTVYDCCMDNYGGTAPNWGGGIYAHRDKLDNITERAILRHNIVHDVWGEGMALGNGRYGTIEDNIVYDVFTVGIYVLNHEYGLVQRNLVYRTKLMGVLANGNQCGIGTWNEYIDALRNKNNTFINNIAYGCNRNFYAGPLIDCVVANNTFMNSCYFSCVQFSHDATTTGSIFKNNIIVQEDANTCVTSDAEPGISFSNNLFNKAHDSDVTGSGDVIADPTLAKTGGTGSGVLTGDYFKLLVGSPAINAGVTISSVTSDYFSVPRSAPTDIGAHEYTGATGNIYYIDTTGVDSSGRTGLSLAQAWLTLSFS